MNDVTINKGFSFTDSLALAQNCLIATAKIVAGTFAAAIGFVIGVISAPYVLYTGIRGGLAKYREVRDEFRAQFSKDADEWAAGDAKAERNGAPSEFDVSDDATGIKGLANKIESYDRLIGENIRLANDLQIEESVARAATEKNVELEARIKVLRSEIEKLISNQ
jgi:hypothetical protein